MSTTEIQRNHLGVLLQRLLLLLLQRLLPEPAALGAAVAELAMFPLCDPHDGSRLNGTKLGCLNGST